jgi:hypothetical protein
MTNHMNRAIIIAAIVLLATPAGAAERVAGCFARAYDRAHLAKHPDQIITAVKLLIKNADSSYYTHYFSLQFKVRGKNESLRTEGSCREDGPVLKCSVECDGGGVNVVHRARDVMMYLDRISVAACGKDIIEEGEELKGGKDDRDFRLDRVADRECAP